MSFDSAFEKTIGLEAGYQCDPEDSGNWTGGALGKGTLKGTKYGLSAYAFPNLDIENLTLDQAKDIYRNTYWDHLKLSFLESDRIQEEIFDTAVNTSAPDNPMTVTKIIQRAINFLESGGENEPLMVDGVFGIRTYSYLKKWDKKDPEALFRALNGEQYRYYRECVYHNPIKKRFSHGWMKRIQDYRGI